MGSESWPRRGLEASRFRAARDTLHAGAVLLASVADSFCAPEPDDSQSNLGVIPTPQSFETKSLGNPDRGRMGLSVGDLELRWVGDGGGSLSMGGRTLTECLAWVERGSGVEGDAASVTRRDYPDMPPNAVLAGAPFPEPDRESLEALFQWYLAADTAIGELRSAEPALGAARVWPHHFDLGALLPVTPPERVVGLGMSPGDATSPDPYFYCAPYPQPDDTRELPALREGAWLRRAQTMAWLPAEVLATTRHPRDVVRSFLDTAVGACRSLVA